MDDFKAKILIKHINHKTYTYNGFFYWHTTTSLPAAMKSLKKDQLQWAAHLYICPVSEIICTKIRVTGLGSLLVHSKLAVQCGEFHV